jgi:TonB-dependent receptor
MCISVFLLSFQLNAQNGSIKGKVIDISNNEPLSYATISIKGTSIGVISNLDGEFEIKNIVSGKKTLLFNYIGYTPLEVDVEVGPGKIIDIGTKELGLASIMGEEVVITSQLRGQASAINQQVKANTIMNTVSKEKIREVPDANAAESLSRLPGITLSRSGGEGSQISVRGVSPRFNSVTVNGQSLPATGNNDRSVNLSMISSEMLDGIEVYKAITPDMDADAVGGSVNLVTKTADPGGIKGNAYVETGYHSLINNLGTYRGSFSLGSRFFNNKLGIVAGANYHKANRNVDYFEGDYETKTDGSAKANNARFFNRFEDRNRYGFNATIDYKFKNGKIVLDHFYSQTDRDVISREMRGRPSTSTIEFSFNKNENYLGTRSTNLRGNYKLFNLLDINYVMGYNFSSNITPYSYGTSAVQESGFLPEVNEASPIEIFKYSRIDINGFTGGSGIGFGDNKLNDKNKMAQIDISAPFSVGSFLSGKIKTGAKIKDKIRSRVGSSYYVLDGYKYTLSFREKFPDYIRNGNVYPTSNFVDQSYTGYDSPFESYNDIPFVFDPAIVAKHYEVMRNDSGLWSKSATDVFANYSVNERITAGYVMAEINLGKKITFIPGVRYENTYNEYTGFNGYRRENDTRIFGQDTTATNSVGLFLPMFHLKIELLKGLSFRLASTKTLSRPNFLNLTPFKQEYRGNQNRVNFGSTELIIPTAWNHDALVSYFSKYGLISIGAFYKNINNIDINVELVDRSGTKQTNPYYGWTVTSPINSEYVTTVYGGEMEVQTSLRFLPEPFNGIVLSGNYSIIRSETYYPFFYTAYLPPTYMPQTVDSFRIGRTQGQADFIANMTIGYERNGFSGRVSMNYQGAKFLSLGGSPFQDIFEDEYIRWDVSLSQKFLKNWQVIVNLVNITNEVETQYTYIVSRPTRIEQYGWQANLGLRYNF